MSVFLPYLNFDTKALQPEWQYFNFDEKTMTSTEWQYLNIDTRELPRSEWQYLNFDTKVSPRSQRMVIIKFCVQKYGSYIRVHIICAIEGFCSLVGSSTQHTSTCQIL